MKRILAACLAATVVFGACLAGSARADGPFETLPLPRPVQRPHPGAYACFLAGAGLIAGSFAIARRADDAYGRYLAAHEARDIAHWFDRTRSDDRLASGALLGGEALLATGVYLRFLRRPASPVALLIGANACAVSYRF